MYPYDGPAHTFLLEGFLGQLSLSTLRSAPISLGVPWQRTNSSLLARNFARSSSSFQQLHAVVQSRGRTWSTSSRDDLDGESAMAAYFSVRWAPHLSPGRSRTSHSWTFVPFWCLASFDSRQFRVTPHSGLRTGWSQLFGTCPLSFGTKTRVGCAAQEAPSAREDASGAEQKCHKAEERVVRSQAAKFAAFHWRIESCHSGGSPSRQVTFTLPPCPERWDQTSHLSSTRHSLSPFLPSNRPLRFESHLTQDAAPTPRPPHRRRYRRCRSAPR